MIYFDHNSTTQIDSQALKVMNEMAQMPLNSSSIHQLGRKAENIAENARQDLQDLLGANNYEVIFTSSATEANNMVLRGLDVEYVIFSKIEHSSIYNCSFAGKKVIELEVDENGLVSLENLQNILNDLPNSNFLVSVGLANNETGVIQPIAEISKIVHQKGGLIHSDIVQAAGKIEVNLEALNIDFASVSAHKINGPQGVGALLMRKGLDINPLIFGGGQEKSKRSGSLNITGIAGFGQACKVAKDNIKKFSEIANLRDSLEEELQKISPSLIRFFSKEVDRLPNTSYFSLKDSDSQTGLIHFDLNGICLSAGAACSSGSLQNKTRILEAMKVDPSFLNGALRVSLGINNTKHEVQKFITIWEKFINKNN